MTNENHVQFITDLLDSNYQNTANWILSDDLIEPEYLDGSEAESPGTYVWVANNTVLYIGEHGYSVRYRMNQHWRSWSKTTRNNPNRSMDESKHQKGDTVLEYLQTDATVKIYSKPAQVVHIQAPHPLRSHQTDFPDMLRLDTKSNDEANLIDAFVNMYNVKPALNGTKGSKGTIISEGYNINE
tara:strand:- start:37 stop:588 length:552 start_codon:yes stop_codon:yes gene_type:complete